MKWCNRLLLAGLILIGFATTANAYTFNEEHPRLYLTQERIEKIQQNHVATDSYEWDKALTAANRSDIDGVFGGAFVYAVTGDPTAADTAIEKMLVLMETPLTANFNSNGRLGNRWACIYDWLYNYEGFQPHKQALIDYVNALPRDRWDWYPITETSGHPYFNGAVKSLWGFPVWGLASYPDNPNWQEYVDGGFLDRWNYIRYIAGYGGEEAKGLALWKSGLPASGRDYGAGTMRNTMLWLEACNTALVDFDIEVEAPDMKNILQAFIYDFMWVDQERLDRSYHFYRSPYGFNAQKGDGYFPTEGTLAWAVVNRWHDDEFAPYVSWFMTQQPGADIYPAKDYRYAAVWACIFKDTSIPQQAPTDLPLQYHATWQDMWLARSNWAAAGEETNVYTTFDAGNWVWFNQNCEDQGNFTLWAYGDFLFIHASYYDGIGAFPVWVYHAQTVGHNSIRILDPDELRGWYPWKDWEKEVWTWNGDTLNVNTGGQKTPYRETLREATIDGERYDHITAGKPQTLHDLADMVRKEGTDEYVYGLGVLTNAYTNAAWDSIYDPYRLEKVHFSPKTDGVEREWVYLREHDAVVMFDRISSTDPTFTKYLDFHTIHEPNFVGNGFDVVGPKGQALVSVFGSSPLHMTKIGGEGYEYWANDRNWDPFPDSHNDLGGNWRIEVSTTTEEAYHTVFTTILTAPAADSIEQTSQETASNEELRTVQVGQDFAVSFSSTFDKNMEVVAYLTDGVVDEHFIFDLVPGQEYVVRSGQHELENAIASEAGVIHLTGVPQNAILLATPHWYDQIPWRSTAIATLLLIILGTAWFVNRVGKN